MILKLKILITILVVLCQHIYSQDVSDIGISGGNRIVLIPTTSVAPVSEFRLQANYESFTHKQLNSLTSLSLASALSSHLELYFKASTENWINSTPLRRIGYGAKFIIPMSFGVMNKTAIWFESINGVNDLGNSLFKSKLIHAAAVINPDILNLDPSILFGVTTTNISNRFLVGAGISKSIGEDIRLGSEATYNYYGSNDLRGSILINKRFFSYIGIQLVSTYLGTASLNAWSFSLGIFVSTSKINFIPLAAENNGKILVPDIDELIKSLDEENKKDDKKENEK